VWSTCDELEAALGQAGLGDWASRLAGAARHTMILETGPVEEGAQARVGASRLGGMPDLPPDVPWPWRPPVSERVWKAHAERPWPLSFVAQIDFAEIQSAGGLEGFPTSGRLLLFYDPICWPDGETAEDQKRASVMFLSEPTDRLARRAFPAEFGNPQVELIMTRDLVSEPRRITPRRWLLPPPPCSSEQILAVDGRPPPSNCRHPQDWEEATVDAYGQFWDGLSANYPSGFRLYDGIPHQLGGTAFPIQASVEADCVKFADDDYHGQPEVKAWFGDPPAFGSPEHETRWSAFQAFHEARDPTYFQRADRWQLVLQVDGTEVAGMEVGQRLYVCIRKEDLAACRFDRCWTVIQRT
jgi:Domain of unknown function (DUF1963)